MTMEFTRHADGPGHTIYAEHINELQEGIEDLQTGVLPITPLANMRVGVANVLDYSGTSTEKIKSALADLSANGGGICSIVGDHEITEKIIVPANVRIANGSFWSEASLRPSSGFADATLLEAYAPSIIEDITLDGDMHATCLHGISILGNGTLKQCTVQRCKMTDFAGRGIWAWTSQGVWILQNVIEDCVIGLYIDEALADGAFVSRNRITNDVAGRMQYGIFSGAGAAQAHTALVISENYIEGADYATTSGAEASGITLFRSPGARVVNNQVTRCGNPANGLGSGIIAGGNAEGSLIGGNHVWDCVTTGIYLETDTVNTDIDTVPGKRGAVTSQNTVHGCLAGMSISYAAGSTAIGNHIYENDMWGIVVDSDFVDVSHNHVYNNWQDADADPPESTDPEYRAGIRSFGANGSFIGNHAFDNQTVPTQYTALAVTQRGSVIIGNQLRATDALLEPSGATANTKSANVEQDV